jgi:hypothetical protein
MYTIFPQIKIYGYYNICFLGKYSKGSPYCGSILLLIRKEKKRKYRSHVYIQPLRAPTSKLRTKEQNQSKSTKT